MPLVKCPECESQISDKASTCPKCGHPMKEGAPAANNKGLVCPKCQSKNIHVDKKGFSGGKACCGFLTCGPLGFLCGTDGSNQLVKHCLDCNNSW